jgi:hypothetical protein
MIGINTLSNSDRRRSSSYQANGARIVCRWRRNRLGLVGSRTSAPIKSIPVKNLDMMTVARGDDLLRDHGSKRTAEGGERQSEICGDARTIHRQVDFQRRLTSCELQMFLQFQKHRELCRCFLLGEEKRVKPAS